MNQRILETKLLLLKSKLCSLDFLKHWSLFYAVVLIAAAIYNYIYNFQYYSFADVFINYQGGFVRRGLFGEMLYRLYGCGINPMRTAVLVCLVSYLAIVLFLLRNFRRRGYSLGLLLTSFLVGGVGIFGICFFRRDFIELCFLLMVVRLWTKVAFRYWVLLANFITIVAILFHEPYAFYGLPVAVVLTHAKAKSWISSLSCWMPSFVAFLLCLYFSGNASVYHAIQRSTESFVAYPNIIEFFTYDSSSVMRMHLHYNFFAVINHLPTVIGSVGSILVTLYFGANATSQYTRSAVSATERSNYFSMLLFLMICQLPMFTVLSTDFTRTCIYASISAYIVIFNTDIDTCAKLLPQWYRSFSERTLALTDRLLPPSRLKILAILLFVGTVQHNGQGTLGLVRDSEFGNMVMVLYKLVRLLCASCL